MHAHHEQKLFISYVPSHRWKKWMIKGYNQSQLLAESVAKELSLTCIALREKTKRTRSQATLTREQRLTNLRGVFTHSYENILPSDATICIIDDITTTGATLEELSRQLKNAEPSIKIR
jgi:predicted amidophosphoribosyltransferase